MDFFGGVYKIFVFCGILRRLPHYFVEACKLGCWGTTAVGDSCLFWPKQIPSGAIWPFFTQVNEAYFKEDKIKPTWRVLRVLGSYRGEWGQSSFIGEVRRDQTKFASKLPESSLIICTKRLSLCQHLLILLLRIFSGNCKQRISRFSTITLNWDFTENLLVSTKNLLCVYNAYDTVKDSQFHEVDCLWIQF